MWTRCVCVAIPPPRVFVFEYVFVCVFVFECVFVCVFVFECVFVCVFRVRVCVRVCGGVGCGGVGCGGAGEGAGEGEGCVSPGMFWSACVCVWL